MAKKKKGGKRNFVLMVGGKSKGILTGKQPRQAALKAATRGYKNIELRERGTKKVHVFTGLVKKVDAPANRPSWMAAKVRKPSVKKIKTYHLARIRK